MASIQERRCDSAGIPASGVGALKTLRTRHIETRDHRIEELDAKLIGESEAMRSLKKSLLTAAGCSSTVLITGESGTGKELIARSIHELSAHRSHPFLAINCGALTESLLESELFGHVKGAFTGATSYKKGMFESACGGTIFLDEFAEMSSAMQVKLLRVLQERKVRPVGLAGSKEIDLEARIIVATNRDLKREVSDGKFRQDLYYRVNVLPIRSPALRDRIEDLPLLINVMLRRLSNQSNAKGALRFDSKALNLLRNHKWPGNVRELENILERLALTASERGIISGLAVRDDLEENGLAEFRRLNKSTSARQDELTEVLISRRLKCGSQNVEAVGQYEQQELELYLSEVAQVGGSLAEAARRLRMKRTTLYMRIRRLQAKEDMRTSL
ncbi:MAG TPA: sigma-54 dependent transcriptional regulator [Pyrinomonadaceae bacterium]|jgi:DNA-binding NtrC family response regulator|nr:sigma-54 dependent transcriptional regulator [Pyrinomonadaceae bacterium]